MNWRIYVNANGPNDLAFYGEVNPASPTADKMLDSARKNYTRVWVYNLVQLYDREPLNARD